MNTLQQEFIDFCVKHHILSFGEFTLKSGRISPYFFNAGLFNSGELLARVGEFYAKALQQSKIKFDGLFGPAYKGIPLVSTLAVQSFNISQKNYPYSFNRKIAKDHGEGGTIVGAPLKGNIIIIDDVITAGTAFYESKTIIEAEGATVAGMLIALDRQECIADSRSAIQTIEDRFHIPVMSIIKLEDLLHYVTQHESSEVIEKIKAYQAQYGIIDKS